MATKQALYVTQVGCVSIHRQFPSLSRADSCLQRTQHISLIYNRPAPNLCLVGIKEYAFFKLDPSYMRTDI